MAATKPEVLMMSLAFQIHSNDSIGVYDYVQNI